jgi:hypothetical protein
MKKRYTLLTVFLSLFAFAQAPQGFNYQATVRNSSGALVVNQNVTFKFNLMQNSPTSVPVYSETHYVPTDDLGAVNLVIGQGTATTGTFSAINWGSGNYYMGIELNTGNGYVAMGTTQLLSVPYALYALNSGTSQTQGKPTIFITGNITNQQAAAQIAAELGPQTDNIYVVNTTGLSAIDLSAAGSLMFLKISANTNLTSVNLNSLSKTLEVMAIESNPMLGTLSFPAYTNAIGQINIRNNAAMTSLTFPVLNNADAIFDIIENTLLTSFSMPLLSSNKNGSINISGTKLTSLSFPALTSCRDLSIYSNNDLTSIIFPVLNAVEYFYIGSNKSLTSVGILSLATAKNISFGLNALLSSQVNSILNKMLSVNPSTGKDIYLSGQVPPAPPTGQGILDKATLINAGNTVTTD